VAVSRSLAREKCACPKCGAPVRASCRRPDGTARTAIHEERMALAHDMATPAEMRTDYIRRAYGRQRAKAERKAELMPSSPFRRRPPADKG
jgi:hypothetical protein